MAELQEFEVRLSSGLKGTVLRTSRFLDKREFNTVKLSNGTELKVPSTALEPQQDGSFYLQVQDGQTHSQAQQEKGSRASGGANPISEELNIDASLFKEDIDVERIPVNRVLDRPAEIRIEDGVTIIPVMEERLKVEKQLILREEIRISKKRTSVRPPRIISLEQNSGVKYSDEPNR
jgi:uncharacterized protein (TIGR02271 family)